MIRLKQRRWYFQEALTASLPAAGSACLEYILLLDAERVSENDYGDVLRFQHETNSYYIKRFKQTSGIRSWLGSSRLRMELNNLKRFSEWGVNAPIVVGYAEDHILTRTLRGILITSGVDRTENLETIAREQSTILKDSTWLNSVLKQTAELVASLHRKHFCHNDLFWRNLLVQNNPDGPVVYVIDCPSGTFWPWPLLYKRRIKDLASLDKLALRYLSGIQRMRFLHYYLAALNMKGDARQLIADVLKYPERRQKRKKRQNWFRRYTS